MTDTTSPSQETRSDLIVERLREKKIESIALIDDAYDPLDTREIGDLHLEAFWAAIHDRKNAAHEQIRQEFDDFNQSHFGGEISRLEDVSDDVLRKLWELRDTFDALKDPLSELFGVKIGKQQQLEHICSLIRGKCSVGGESIVQIKTLGSSREVVTELEGVAIVFIDYHLGVDNNPDAIKRAIQRANEITADIYERYASGKLPLVILMSSSPSVKEQQDQFRRDSGWLNGLFYCVTKQDLEDAAKIGINLGTWIERLEEGSKIQQFADAVERSLDTAVKEFVKSVRGLSLEDYAYVQDFSLSPDGHPMGEYMLWLFNAYLGRLAFENNSDVNTQQRIISRFSFDRLPLNQLMPSPDLIEMYDSALFNRYVGDITEPASAAPGESAGEGGGGAPAEKEGKEAQPLPHLRLGLLFVKDASSEVWMVLNADCDLAHTLDGSRRPTPVVALIAGELVEIKTNVTALREPKTDFFKYRGNAYHIRWQVKKILFLEYAKVLGDLSAQGYQPYALLRLPYALEVQRAYAAHFARIGMPVAPPIQHRVEAEIIYKNAEGKAETLLEAERDLVFLITVRDAAGAEGKNQLRCRFTTHFVHKLKKAVVDLRGIYERALAVVEGEEQQAVNTRKQLGSKVGKLDELLVEFDDLFLRNPSPDLAGIKKPIALYPNKNQIGIFRNIKNKEEFDAWGNHLLVVNLIDPDGVEESSSDAEGA